MIAKNEVVVYPDEFYRVWYQRTNLHAWAAIPGGGGAGHVPNN